MDQIPLGDVIPAIIMFYDLFLSKIIPIICFTYHECKSLEQEELKGEVKMRSQNLIHKKGVQKQAPIVVTPSL